MTPAPPPKPKRWRMMRNISSIQLPSILYVKGSDGQNSDKLSPLAVGAGVGLLVLASIGVGAAVRGKRAESFSADDEGWCITCWDRKGIHAIKTQHCDECGEGICDACGDIATGGCDWETIICNEPVCFDVHVEGCSSCLEYIEENEAESFEAETRHCVKCDKVTGVLDEHEVCDLYSIFDYDDFLTMSSFKRGGLYGMICEECKLPHSGSSYCSICNRSQPIEMRGGKPACTSCGYLLTEWRAHRDKERAQRGAESFEAPKRRGKGKRKKVAKKSRLKYRKMSKMQKRWVSAKIREILRDWKETGRIGTSKPANSKVAQRQAIAVAYSMAGKKFK